MLANGHQRSGQVRPAPRSTTTSARNLASHVLPWLHGEVARNHQYSTKTGWFAQPGVTEMTLIKQLGLSGDFSGCDVFLAQGRPFYAGISRGVIKRLRQYVSDKPHYGASLAYKMASQTVGHRLTRDEAMKDPLVA